MRSKTLVVFDWERENGNLWLFPYWRVVQIVELFFWRETLQEANACWRISAEGWPNQACQRVDGVVLVVTVEVTKAVGVYLGTSCLGN